MWRSSIEARTGLVFIQCVHRLQTQRALSDLLDRCIARAISAIIQHHSISSAVRRSDQRPHSTAPRTPPRRQSTAGQPCPNCSASPPQTCAPIRKHSRRRCSSRFVRCRTHSRCQRSTPKHKNNFVSIFLDCYPERVLLNSQTIEDDNESPKVD